MYWIRLFLSLKGPNSGLHENGHVHPLFTGIMCIKFHSDDMELCKMFQDTN